MAGREIRVCPGSSAWSKAQRIPRAGLALEWVPGSPWGLRRDAESRGDHWAGPPTKTKTPWLLAGSQSSWDNGPWPKSAFLGQPRLRIKRDYTGAPLGHRAKCHQP